MGFHTVRHVQVFLSLQSNSNSRGWGINIHTDGGVAGLKFDGLSQPQRGAYGRSRVVQCEPVLGHFGHFVGFVDGIDDGFRKITRKRGGLVVHSLIFMGDRQADLKEVARTIEQLYIIKVEGGQTASIAVQPKVQHEGDLVEGAAGHTGKVPLQGFPVVRHCCNGVQLRDSHPFQFELDNSAHHGRMNFQSERSNLRQIKVFRKCDNGTRPNFSTGVAHHFRYKIRGVVVVDGGVFHHCGLGHFEIDKLRGRFRSLKIKRQVDLSKRSGGR